MITGNLKDIDDIHQFHPMIKMAMKDIIEKMDDALARCQKFEVMGQDMYWYSDAHDGCECEDTSPEFHDQYVDIEVVLKGREVIGYSESNQYDSVCDDHILDQDVAFVEGIKDEKYLSLGEGDFAIFYPGDVHRPCYRKDDKMIQKAVIKINKALL